MEMYEIKINLKHTKKNNYLFLGSLETQEWISIVRSVTYSFDNEKQSLIEVLVFSCFCNLLVIFLYAKREKQNKSRIHTIEVICVVQSKEIHHVSYDLKMVRNYHEVNLFINFS